ncbi:MAG TPA: 6-phosphogluconolactonase [Gemmatimonadaceae bacterium]
MVSEVRVFDDAEQLNAAAAERMAAAALTAVGERGRFLLVLAGGSTPRGAYAMLAAAYGESIDWGRVHVFWGDERCVAPDHPVSNYRMAAESLLRRVDLPDANVHRIRGEEPAETAAATYDRELADFFRAATPADIGSESTFDLVLLGIGEDGHTASLFPDSPALAATGWAAPAQAPESAEVVERVTLTVPAINSARECLFLVAGAAKRHVIQQLLASPAIADDGASSPLPAARVHPRGQSLWFLDAAAAARLPLDAI